MKLSNLSWPKPGIIFYVLRFLFRAGLFVFYHSVEVVNRDALLNLDMPTILLVNHCNSLIDAAMVLTSCAPKVVKLTAKDTLWKHPFWGYCMRGTGTVPFQRADDHRHRVDNRGAFDAINESLDESSDACIAIFPEGRSRYLPHLLPLKSGAAHIALNFALHKGKGEGSNRKVAVLPCGISYLHREKFRSSVLVEFGKAVLIEGDKVELSTGKELHVYGSNVALNNSGNSIDIEQYDESTLARLITSDVQNQMENLTLSSPNWHTLALAQCARKLARPPPKDCYLTLHEHVSTTRSFISLLKEKENEKDMGNNTTDAEGEGEGEGKGESSSSTTTTEVELLKRDMTVYMRELNDLGLKDERISSMGSTVHIWEKTSLMIIGRILFRIFLSLPYTLLILPGMFCLFPLMLFVRYEEWRILKKPGGIEMNKDELAQYKMAYVLILPGIAIFSASVIIAYLYSSFFAFFFAGFVLLLYTWLTVRGMEDIIANTRAIASLFKLLKHGKRLERLRRIRSELSKKLTAFADRHDVMQVNGRYVALWEYFNPLRRRKKDWNEVMRLYDMTPGL